MQWNGKLTILRLYIAQTRNHFPLFRGNCLLDLYYYKYPLVYNETKFSKNI
jgi:hypothetical protein